MRRKKRTERTGKRARAGWWPRNIYSDMRRTRWW
ncbi:unnamed protein product [Staurois parvus]|uniref:Uncharacterized protein n=1 Tax=Staurois parvus TaxID=386267 RepID=A0ABN9BEW2_9NEOB|nr:unnamed protein product [Staurois parvus]